MHSDCPVYARAVQALAAGLDNILTSPALAGMRAVNQWVVYEVKPDPKRPGKLAKLPVHYRTRTPCSVVEPANWGDIQTAVASARAWGSSYGVGFCFVAGGPYWFVDLDSCLQPDGITWSPLAQQLAGSVLAGAAVEVSASGKGLHLFGRGTVPAHASKNIPHGAELYTEGRFCALTGTSLQGNCDTDHTAAIAWVAQTYFPARVAVALDVPNDGPRADYRGPADDEELLRRAMRSKSKAAMFGGSKATFAELWTADADALGRAYPADPGSLEPFDRSSADAALASHLAFWAGCEAARMERLMRRSGLTREKYERPDYLPRTVANACAIQRDVLQDKPPQPGPTIPPALPASGAHGLTLLRADLVPLTPIEWLWAGFLPVGMLTILGGAPGCGKTTIAMDLGSIVSKGGAWPDGTHCALPGDVLVWTGEDLPSILSGRLAAMGADRARVHFVGDVGEGAARRAFDPGRDMAMLEAAARALPAPRLLIVDPIVSAVAGDSHKNAEVRRALQPVVDLAQRLGCAVLGITHFTKGTAGRDPTERITGSLAFGALARVVLAAAKVKNQESDEPRRVLVRAKSNIGPDDGGFAYELERVPVGPGNEGQRVNWLEPLHGSAREVLAEADTDEAPPAPAAPELVRFVERRLLAGPIESAAWQAEAEAAGFQWRKVTGEAKRRGARPGKFGMAKGWFWQIADSHTWARTCTSSPEPTNSATSNKFVQIRSC